MEIFDPYEKVLGKISDQYNRKEPFLFAINFNKTLGFCINPTYAQKTGLRFSITENSFDLTINHKDVELISSPLSYEDYTHKFDKIRSHIENGDTYLVNLTQETPIQINIGLEEIYERSKAPFKLFVPGYFAVFSPEPFIQIDKNTIRTMPMKGTISGDHPDNKHILKLDPKENAEHNTIVDLLRNDLSIIATDVYVKKLKYIELVKTHSGSLYQMSSEIEGTIRQEFINDIGSLIDHMLPAGSVSGAPKLKTVSIIREVEAYDRGFYTGIFGYFDGTHLRSAVMIRFIENRGDQYYYKSGGGLTALSDPILEYKELLQKIYVPIF